MAKTKFRNPRYRKRRRRISSQGKTSEQSYAQRVTLALYLCGAIENIEPKRYGDNGLEVVEIDLKNKPEWYTRDINPSGKVPALEITTHSGAAACGGKGKRVLVESALLARFVLAAAESPLVVGLSPCDEYDIGRFAEIFSGLQPLFYGALRGPAAGSNGGGRQLQTEMLAKFHDCVRAIGAALPSDRGPFAMGSEFSFADVLCASFLVRLAVLEHYRPAAAIPRTPGEFARFHTWVEACAAHPALKATTAPLDVLLHGYAAMAGVVAAPTK